jgi:hypothetical protein
MLLTRRPSGRFRPTVDPVHSKTFQTQFRLRRPLVFLPLCLPACASESSSILCSFLSTSVCRFSLLCHHPMSHRATALRSAAIHLAHCRRGGRVGLRLGLRWIATVGVPLYEFAGYQSSPPGRPCPPATLCFKCFRRF